MTARSNRPRTGCSLPYDPARLDIAAAGHNYACRNQHIGRLIRTDEWQFDLADIALNAKFKRLPQLRWLARNELDALALFADSYQPHFALFDAGNYLVRPQIIRPDNSSAVFVDNLIEQPHLGLEIVFHRP